MEIKTTTKTSRVKFCPCGHKSRLCVDRFIDNKEACPACDPELGNNPEERIENYKILISTPVPDFVSDLFKK